MVLVQVNTQECTYNQTKKQRHKNLREKIKYMYLCTAIR